MRAKLLSLVMVVAIALASFGTAGAVQYGVPDGNGHPYVGLMLAYDASKTPLWRCTGTLVSPTVFLSAGHCTGTDGTVTPAYVQVWFEAGPLGFDANYIGGSCNAGGPYTTYPCAGGYWGVPQPHPNWNGALTIPNTHDIGVVVLNAPRPGPYGVVAPAGYLDGLAKQRGLQNVEFTVVGYGLQSVKPIRSGVRERYVGTVSLINLGSALADGFNIHYSSAPGNGVGPGGTCFGDSGGPVFHTNASGQKVVVAVNSFVLNSNCKGAGFGYRTDSAVAQNFLSGYLP
ncbi:MAG: trypsin-like serine protease [Anaerolineales bacterium]|nr:trypsin-like serine protease [Anaerolineales bacterium]